MRKHLDGYYFNYKEKYEVLGITKMHTAKVTAEGDKFIIEWHDSVITSSIENVMYNVQRHDKYAHKELKTKFPEYYL